MYLIHNIYICILKLGHYMFVHLRDVIKDIMKLNYYLL